MLKVQPACSQVYSAEPALCHGLLDAPSSGTQPPVGLSHCAVKRTDISAEDPSPASCARAPSCVGLQMFTLAHDEASCSGAAEAGATRQATTAAERANGVRIRDTRVLFRPRGLLLERQSTGNPRLAGPGESPNGREPGLPGRAPGHAACWV